MTVRVEAKSLSPVRVLGRSKRSEMTKGTQLWILAAYCCVFVLDHHNHHVQDCSDKTSSQLYHPCPGREIGFKAPSGGHCSRKTRPAIVRSRPITNRPDSNTPFPVFRDLAQTLANPLTLCGHGLAAKARILGYVQLSPYQSHAVINHGILGYVLRMRDPTNPLGFIIGILRLPHCVRSRMSESCSHQGGGSRRNASPQKVSHVQSRFSRQETQQNGFREQESSTTNGSPHGPS